MTTTRNIETYLAFLSKPWLLFNRKCCILLRFYLCTFIRHFEVQKYINETILIIQTKKLSTLLIEIL